MKHLITLVTLWAYSFAAMANDPFSKATEKTEALSGALAGSIAIAVTVLVVTIAGFALMFNKLQQATAMRIIGGAIVIGSASSIAAFLF